MNSNHSMFNRRLPRLVLICFLYGVASTMLGGCGRTELCSVVGRVLVNGVPMPDAMVAFHPLAGEAGAKVLPVATSSQDGSFLLTTYTNGDGAPLGEYAVTIVWPDRSAGQDECNCGVIVDRLGGRYADREQTPWKIAVHPGKNEFTFAAIVQASGWSNPRSRDSAKVK